MVYRRLPPLPRRAPWARVVDNTRSHAFGTMAVPLGYRRTYWLHRRRFFSPRARDLVMRMRARVRQRLSASRIPGEVINNIMAYAGW